MLVYFCAEQSPFVRGFQATRSSRAVSPLDLNNNILPETLRCKAVVSFVQKQTSNMQLAISATETYDTFVHTLVQYRQIFILESPC